MKHKSYLQKIISENLGIYRKAANLTVKLLAERAFTEEAEVNKLENPETDQEGKTICNFPLLVAITEALKIRLEDLFESNNEYIQKYMVPIYFYELFDKVRIEKNINKKIFCKNVGIKGIDYYNWKTARKYPAIEKIQNILTLLNIKSTDLKYFENEYKAQHTEEESVLPKRNETIKAKTKNAETVTAEKSTNPVTEEEPIQIINKAYNLYKDIEKYIDELDRIIQSAEKLKKELESHHK